MTEQHWRDAAVQGETAPAGDRLHGRVRVTKPEVRPSVGALHNQHVRARHSRDVAAGLAQFDVARVQKADAIVLEPQLRGAKHVAGGVKRHSGRPTPHRLVISQHPPAARPAGFGDERQRLRSEQRLLVAAGVIGVRVRDERKGAHDQRVEPQAVLGQ